MDKFTKDEHNNGFVWYPQLGYGYFPVKEFPYNESYFQHYVDLEGSEIAEKLNKCRVDLTNKWIGNDIVVDIGIGSGTFIQARPNTRGFDVNPVGVKWLKDKDLWANPWNVKVKNVTMWDVIEHIDDPTDLLANVQEYVILSTPIYRNCEHVLGSKHFKKTEHCYYFTLPGIVGWMRKHGFEMLEYSPMEMACGRQDIGAFVFKRIK